MQINLVAKGDWDALRADPSGLLQRIEGGDVFIVRQFLSIAQVDQIKQACLAFGATTGASWHPCLDGCPDYHRIHHNYPKAHVPSIQHGYYFHPWNERFASLTSLGNVGDVFELKRDMGGMTDSAYFTNLPSEGPIARLVCHQYPRGGGGQAEHIDPVSPFAKVQTLIQASTPGIDYGTGGLYINDPRFGIVNIDPLTRKGDLILASPGVKHGVAAIDPGEQLQWSETDGRWIIMPIIIHSDHVTGAAVRPVTTAAT